MVWSVSINRQHCPAVFLQASTKCQKNKLVFFKKENLSHISSFYAKENQISPDLGAASSFPLSWELFLRSPLICKLAGTQCFQQRNQCTRNAPYFLRNKQKMFWRFHSKVTSLSGGKLLWLAICSAYSVAHRSSWGPLDSVTAHRKLQ